MVCAFAPRQNAFLTSLTHLHISELCNIGIGEEPVAQSRVDDTQITPMIRRMITLPARQRDNSRQLIMLDPGPSLFVDLETANERHHKSVLLSALAVYAVFKNIDRPMPCTGMTRSSAT